MARRKAPRRGRSAKVLRIAQQILAEDTETVFSTRALAVLVLQRDPTIAETGAYWTKGDRAADPLHFVSGDIGSLLHAELLPRGRFDPEKIAPNFCGNCGQRLEKTDTCSQCGFQTRIR